MEQNLKLKIMLKTTDKIAVWMESNLDDDYGKMGISALRYLNNEIVCVVDSTFAGKKLSEVSIQGILSNENESKNYAWDGARGESNASFPLNSRNEEVNHNQMHKPRICTL